jgi:hypothetical protein
MGLFFLRLLDIGNKPLHEGALVAQGEQHLNKRGEGRRVLSTARTVAV